MRKTHSSYALNGGSSHIYTQIENLVSDFYVQYTKTELRHLNFLKVIFLNSEILKVSMKLWPFYISIDCQWTLEQAYKYAS